MSPRSQPPQRPGSTAAPQFSNFPPAGPGVCVCDEVDETNRLHRPLQPAWPWWQQSARGHLTAITIGVAQRRRHTPNRLPAPSRKPAECSQAHAYPPARNHALRHPCDHRPTTTPALLPLSLALADPHACLASSGPTTPSYCLKLPLASVAGLSLGLVFARLHHHRAPSRPTTTRLACELCALVSHRNLASLPAIARPPARR